MRRTALPKSDMIATEREITAIHRGGVHHAESRLHRDEGTITRMRGHGFYTVLLANGHEVLARMSGRMSKNHIRVIQDDRVLLEISPADWSQGRIVYRYK